MDQFKAAMHSKCSVGGLYCECCNPWHGKAKRKLNRIVRRKLKQDARKDVVEYQQEEDENFWEWFHKITS